MSAVREHAAGHVPRWRRRSVVKRMSIESNEFALLFALLFALVMTAVAWVLATSLGLIEVEDERPMRTLEIVELVPPPAVDADLWIEVGK